MSFKKIFENCQKKLCMINVKGFSVLHVWLSLNMITWEFPNISLQCWTSDVCFDENEFFFSSIPMYRLNDDFRKWLWNVYNVCHKLIFNIKKSSVWIIWLFEWYIGYRYFQVVTFWTMNVQVVNRFRGIGLLLLHGVSIYYAYTVYFHR